jgi:hypothetical protein
MNEDEHPDDSTLTRELRDALSKVAAPERPPLAAITNRGRAHQRRRLAGFAGLGVTGVAAATALALGLTGVLGGAPARSTGTIRTAAFVLTRNANGTDTLTFSKSHALKPAALQQALAQDGIRALVKINTDCSSNPAPPSASSLGVVSIQLPDGTPVSIPTTHEPGTLIPANAVIVFKPSAMPTGTEMFVGYRSYGTRAIHTRLNAFHLIYTNSYTCSNGFPADGQKGS